MESPSQVGLPGYERAVAGAKLLAYQSLLSGFEPDGKVWDRSVDVQPLPDGSLLVSDDLAGALYRVSDAKLWLTSPGGMNRQ